MKLQEQKLQFKTHHRETIQGKVKRYRTGGQVQEVTKTSQDLRETQIIDIQTYTVKYMECKEIYKIFY